MRIAITLPDDDGAWLRDWAETQGKTASEAIADLLAWERRWDAWVCLTTAQARKDDYDTLVEITHKGMP